MWITEILSPSKIPQKILKNKTASPFGDHVIELTAARDTQLAENLAQMCPNRVNTHTEILRDLLIGVTGGSQLGHATLAGGQFKKGYGHCPTR
jgi:hypothetical protein